jgi:hypothetical protein
MGNLLTGFLEKKGNIAEKIISTIVADTKLPLQNSSISGTEGTGVNSSKSLFEPQYSNPKPLQQVENQSFTKCTEALGKVNVEDVFSLQFVKAEKIVISIYKNSVKKRFDKKFAYLNGTKFKTNEVEYVEKMKGLFSEIQDYMSENTDDDLAAKEFYKTLNVPSEKNPTKTKFENIKAELVLEKGLISKITDSGLIDWCKQFREALEGNEKDKITSFLDSVKRYTEEKTEFYRFDFFYKDEIFQKINKALKTVTFYPSEIKALNCQETGDLADSNIEGITKITGLNIPTTEGKGRNYRGLCQLPNSKEFGNSIEEAIKWAQEKAGVTLLSDPATPQNAIYLTIAYLGRIEEMFIAKTGGWLPNDCLSLKKIYFSGYNKGVGYFGNAAIEHLYKGDEDAIAQAKGKAKSKSKSEKESNYIKEHPPKNTVYNFDTIKESAYAQIKKTYGEDKVIEVKNYIKEITQRLS